MTIKMKSGFLALALLLVFSGTAMAHVTLEILGYGSASDMSGDGSVIVGVDPNQGYETFRWTPSSGVVLLGQNSTYVGGGAGTPDVSKDGTRVSATVLSADSTHVTAGIWTDGQGWMDLSGPYPPDMGILDSSNASAWGMSGDGNVVTGLFWRPGQPIGGTAHGFRWEESTGIVSMVDSNSQNSRINDADYDGDVLVGWSANPGFGNWWPTVWVDGVQTVLDSIGKSCILDGVNDDGTIVMGQNAESETGVTGAAYWTWNGSSWDYTWVGALFATHPVYGNASLTASTPDGSIMVGYNAFDPGNSEGIMYTQADGLVDISQWLLSKGVSVPPDFKIRSLVAITDDGSMVCGTGQELVYPYGFKFFRIHLEDEAATDAPLPSRVATLGDNYPNPFNPSTTIPVILERGEDVVLEIYDVRGQKVQSLHSGHLGAGRHDFSWNGTDANGALVASGTYMARLRTADGEDQSTRMVLVK